MSKPVRRRAPAPSDFTEAAPIGTRVRYYSVLPADADDFFESSIQSDAWDLCGRTVVKIAGRSGGVDVGHLVLVNPVKRIGGVAGFVTSR